MYMLKKVLVRRTKSIVSVSLVFIAMCTPYRAQAGFSRLQPVESVVIGRSVSQKPIVASRYGSGPIVVVAVGAIHGNEASSAVVARYIAEQKPPSEFSLWVIEVANPDSFYTSKRSRGNFNGVDLNRNFPTLWAPLPCPARNCSGASPASEPETKALMFFFIKVKPSMVVFYHSSASPSVVDASYRDVHNYEKVKKYAKAANVRIENVSCGLPCTGTATQFVNETIPAATSFVVELTCDGLKCLKSSVIKSHVRAFWAAAEA